MTGFLSFRKMVVTTFLAGLSLSFILSAQAAAVKPRGNDHQEGHVLRRGRRVARWQKTTTTRGLSGKDKKSGEKNSEENQKKEKKKSKKNSSTLPEQDLGEATFPFVKLLEPLSRFAFNPLVGPLCIVLENAEFDDATVSLSLNSILQNPVITNTAVCVESANFASGPNAIEFSATTLPVSLSETETKPVPVSLSTTIQAGELSTTIILEDESGNPYTETAEITAALSDDALVMQTLSTCKCLAKVRLVDCVFFRRTDPCLS